MGANTKIEWAHHTLNPWLGCTKVSSACDHCYAESWAKRTGQAGLWQGERRRTTPANWRQPIKWNQAARAAGVRHRVFCASLADVFDNQVPPEWRDDLWDLIDVCRDLDWLLLTKRPQNIAKMFPAAIGWPHVWLGATAENQEEADRRIPHLLAVPTAVHFISAEPLLGPLDLTRWLRDGHPTQEQIDGPRGMHYLRHGAPRLSWVIAGGESGPHARPTHPDWARSIRDQCAAAGVSFHFKQWGEFSPEMLPPVTKAFRWPIEVAEAEGGVWSYRVGKKHAGRLLDGREHNGFPS